jgi:hypothetical protein
MASRCSSTTRNRPTACRKASSRRWHRARTVGSGSGPTPTTWPSSTRSAAAGLVRCTASGAANAATWSRPCSTSPVAGCGWAPVRESNSTIRSAARAAKCCVSRVTRTTTRPLAPCTWIRPADSGPPPRPKGCIASARICGPSGSAGWRPPSRYGRTAIRRCGSVPPTACIGWIATACRCAGCGRPMDPPASPVLMACVPSSAMGAVACGWCCGIAVWCVSIPPAIRPWRSSTTRKCRPACPNSA